eukprot:scaffold3932_cov87-Cyclotella_meneghiniana.AAC.11
MPALVPNSSDVYLCSNSSTFRASSTWQHNSKKFGALNALNNETEDAWKSDASKDSDPCQYYEIHFKRKVTIDQLRIQFQGGFVGMDCIVYHKTCENGEWEEFDELFMDTVESNEMQIFTVEHGPNQTPVQSCEAIRIEFGKSSDFYGRLVIYSLEVWGSEE